jgi:23S rRNA-/tRNA-specific pseudouridylate synthase
VADKIVSFVVGAGDEGATIAAALRRQLRQDPDGASWAQVRRLCTTGKVFVDDERALDPAARVRVGQTVAVKYAAPRPDLSPPGFRIVFDDAHLVVIDKPSGISSVPFDRKETGTAMDLVRGVWRRRGKRATATPLYVVHRIDKDTSGLLCFAKTRLAERALHAVFQRHTADRHYLALAEGDVAAMRIESNLVAIAATVSAGPCATPARRSTPRTPSRLWNRSASCRAPPSAAFAWRPGAPTRSGSTSPNGATRSSAKRSTFATCFATVKHLSPRHA